MRYSVDSGGAEYLSSERGVLLYLFQEGHGAGLYSKYLSMNRARNAMAGTHRGLSNQCLNLTPDSRCYQLAARAIADLQCGSISVLTNNPSKTRQLLEHGMNITGSRRLIAELTTANFEELFWKFDEMGHSLESLFREHEPGLFLVHGARPREME